MKQQIAIAFLSLILSCSLSAEVGGSEAGNGGSSIVCLDAAGTIASVELLDYYEARTQRGIQVDLGPAADSVEAKIAMAVKRLERLDPEKAENLGYYAKTFLEKSKFFSGVHLVEIPDSQHLFIPTGCRQEQIAIRREPIVPEDRRFNINKDLWDHLDNDNKAGLILHEVLYFMATEAEDSKMVRYLVSKLSSLEGETWMQSEFVEVLRQLRFQDFFYESAFFKIDQLYPVFSATGSMLGGPVSGSNPIMIQNQSVDPTFLQFDLNGDIEYIKSRYAHNFQIHGQSVWFQENEFINLSGKQILGGYAVYGSQNVFKKSGQYELQIKAMDKKPVKIGIEMDGTLNQCRSCEGLVTIAGTDFPIGVPQPNSETGWLCSLCFMSAESFDLSLAHPILLTMAGQDAFFEGHIAGYVRDELWRSGGVRIGNLAADAFLKAGSKLIKFAKRPVVFFDDGTVAEATLAEDTLLQNQYGQTIQYVTGMTLHFMADGSVGYATVDRSKQKHKGAK